MPICPTCRQIFANGVEVCPNDGETLLPGNTLPDISKELPSGMMVGEYRVEEKIGEGGFGTVYRGEHPLIGKKVAIKVLHTEFSSDPKIVSRFVSEARAVNKIRHKNIIDIFAFGVLEDGRQYFVMEYLDGQPFDQYLQKHSRLSAEAAIPILWRIAKALDAAHAAGIAHRDLKPENVFLTFDDEGTITPKLLDFGIAKLLRDKSTGPKTQTGTPIGTPHYMSPEQCLGKNVDVRTDIYSFGVMVYEVLTGKKPFDADAVMQIFFLHMNEPAPAMSSVVPDLPSNLDAPVQAMMAKSPDNRPRSLVEAMRSLAMAAKEAGYDIPPIYTDGNTSQSGSHPESPANRVVVAGSSSTPVTPADIMADTLVATENPSTNQPIAPTLKSPSSSTRFGMIAAGLLLVAIALGAAGVFLFKKGQKSVTANSSVTSSAKVRTTQATTSAAPAASVPTPSASSAPSAASKPAFVTVTIDSTPKKVSVYFDGKKLGNSGDVLKLPRGNKQVSLTVSAPGFVAKKVAVTPKDDVVVSVSLRPSPAITHKATTKKKGLSSEIENPFR